MQRPLNQILLRWELDPPAFSIDELNRSLSETLDVFRYHNLLREAVPSGAWTCTECGEVRQVTFVIDASEQKRRGYIACPTCGVTPLRDEQLNRVSIDTGLVLQHIFGDIRLSVRPIVADHLWQIGRTAISSRSRELWFVRGLGPAYHQDILRNLSHRPKTVLFTPSEATADYWSRIITNPIIPLEDTLIHDQFKLSLDWDAVHDRVAEYEETATPRERPQPKRATRTAKIERLHDEIKKHLASAVAYAESTVENGGYSELLPRPTQDQLAKQTGLTKSDVSRCLKDESANELRLLWETANDVEAVLRLRREKLQ